MNFNKVILGARLTRDPALKFLPSQTAVVEFGVACNRRWKTQAGEEKEEVTYVDCTAFARTGEVINEYFKRGDPILLEGRLTYQSWDDKNGGGKRSKLLVTVESFQFVGGKNGGNQGDASPEAEERPARPVNHRGPMEQGGGQHTGAAANFARAVGAGARGKATAAEPPFGDEEVFKDQDIPFKWQGRRGSAV